MIRTVLINAPLDNFTPDHRTAWTTWLEQHGLDSMRIPVPSQIDIDTHHRRITAVYYKFDENKHLIVDKHHNPITHAVVIQLESSPLPPPGGFDTWIDK